MRAICIEGGEDGAELVPREVERPQPGPQELLVRVRASGVNFADLYRARQHFGASSAVAVAGLEMAGEVVAVGAAVDGIQPGERVMGLTAGTYAEYCCIHHSHAIRIPTELSWTDAAATVAVFMTAHDALVTNGCLAKGETVLVQAASSGVGIAATQIARHLDAGLVMGTSTSDAKLERLAELGLQLGINSTSEDFSKVVLEATDGRGVDVIVENIGGDTLPGDMRCAAVKCRIINVGRLGKWTGEIDLDEHSRKRIKLIGVSFRSRSIEEHALVARRFAEDLMPAFRDGKLKPIVHRAFRLEEAAEAQTFMKAKRHFGKLVLQLD